MIIVGLTGSIGMGKSTTAKLFADAGAYVFDADAVVHKLYDKGGAAVPLLKAVFPDVVVNGAVDRKRLSKHLQADPLQIQVLESFIHPMVQEIRNSELAQARTDGKKVFVADIPLLLEGGGAAHVDKIVVVSAPEHIQHQRVMSRADMSIEKFELIKARQMPDAEKRARADYIVETDKGLSFARDQVLNIMADILNG